MDRRTLLAIVLIFAMTLIWSKMSRQFYGAPEDDAGAAADSSRVVEAPDAGTGTARDVASTPLPVREQAPDPVRDSRSGTLPAGDVAGAAFSFKPAETLTATVETDLFHAEFSTHGAVPLSWRLVEYPGFDNPAVELIPAPDELAAPPSSDVLVFSRGAIETGSIAFEMPGETDLDATFEPKDLVFIARTYDGVTLKKTLSFQPDRYAYAIRYDISFESSDARDAFFAKYGDPISTRFVWDRGIAVTEASVSGMARRMQTERAFSMVGEEMRILMQKDLTKGGDKAGGTFRGTVRFAGLQNKYFTILGFVPQAHETVVDGRIRLGGNPETMNQSWEIELPMRETAGTINASVSRYLGPSEYDRLKDYGSSLEKTVNLGWKWIEWLSEFVLNLLNWLHRFIPNYGWVIVVVSILSKLVFYPLTARGTRAMKKMQESQARLKPKMDALKEKCGKDSQRYNQELMKLYREEGVNPMAGMAGCLPMLIQMPVFIALYQVLYNMVDLRQTPFIFWINDLSRPDALFALPFSLPLLGSSFNLLPIIMAVATWAQTKMTPQAGGAGNQMAAMNNIMPVMMLFFLYNMPSGLVIYWTINTAMTAFQSWTVNRSAAADAGAQA